MKTITIKFSRPGEKPFCVAVGTFVQLPGPGPVAWSGGVQAFVDAISRKLSELPKHHFAESFDRALVAVAVRAGLEASMTEIGEWEV